MRSSLHFVSVAAIAAMLAAVPGSAQKTSGPKERYEMDVATASGFAAMAAGGGGMGSALGMMLGGGPDSKVAHTLDLRLGSNQAPTSPPVRADHYFEPQTKLGKSVPLLGPEPGKWAPREETSDTMPDGFERPKGRMLLFWGCGAKAGPGQPVIIDFAKLAAGQMPPNLFTSTVPRIREVTTGNSKSYAGWPNSKSSKQPPKDSSLLGAHRIAGNVGPDISFTLAQDYMPALNASTAQQADGSILIRWNQLAPATGYVAWAFGGMDRGGAGGDMVWWTSSSAREFGGGLWDWLPPSVVANLVTKKIVMPPTQTSCQIPAEVKKASGEMLMGNLNAFGPEANFAYPPKPAGNAVWNIDWTAKVRFRSHTMLMIGADFGGMGAAGGAGDASAPAEKPRKKKCKGPLGIPLPDGAC
ncbi:MULTISPECIES: hypothetical protein [Sphingopyxis]|uniref:Uncharacterized protein n=1 Tax=Sphingopyxis granuli TaxID=267128 RepID=A0AA86GNG5_9SPHN|nr:MULTISPECIES: hypothetical protein [Sphingopyxis]AMG76362.1 Uncharacterized protein SGRAN_4035 [Sphingopyxis granuli]APW73922.1 hypothetical protein BWD40_14910 [Sphingopyxis granuli]AVA15252.1 hypothetical protein C3E99_16590 [Sphingopyxis sp. MG]ODU28971.1 MAG: hypothetical protein ABS88_10585 [Sphingopyxis sp. SCN 67-31]